MRNKETRYSAYYFSSVPSLLIKHKVEFGHKNPLLYIYLNSGLRAISCVIINYEAEQWSNDFRRHFLGSPSLLFPVVRKKLCKQEPLLLLKRQNPNTDNLILIDWFIFEVQLMLLWWLGVLVKTGRNTGREKVMVIGTRTYRCSTGPAPGSSCTMEKNSGKTCPLSHFCHHRGDIWNALSGVRLLEFNDTWCRCHLLASQWWREWVPNLSQMFAPWEDEPRSPPPRFWVALKWD